MMPDPDEGPAGSPGGSEPERESDRPSPDAPEAPQPTDASADEAGPADGGPPPRPDAAGPVSDDEYEPSVDDDIEPDVYEDEDDDSDDEREAPGPDATNQLLNALAEGFGLLEEARERVGGEGEDGEVVVGPDGSPIETDAEGRAILRAIARPEDEEGEEPAAVTPEEVAPIMEALLFVSATPLTPERLRDLMGLDSIIPIRRAADRLRGEYDNRGRSFELVERANGYILQTRAEFEAFVTKLRRARLEQRMTHAALVTLAIVAYKQPITRSEIDSIRGAGSAHHLRNLVERGLVRVVGRKHAPGYPSLYGTTSAFLRQFGLRSLRDLPQEAEFGETDVEAIRAASREDLHDGEEDEGLPTVGDDGTPVTGGEDGPGEPEESSPGDRPTDEDDADVAGTDDATVESASTPAEAAPDADPPRTDDGES